MELIVGRVGCIVVVFFLGYYFGRQARPGGPPPAATPDPADWWKRGEDQPWNG